MPAGPDHTRRRLRDRRGHSAAVGAYQVTGLDIAPGMLAVAREKLPAALPLHLADMSGFELGTRFDAIVCAYQGINHLLSFPAWVSFFAHAGSRA